MLLFFFFFFFFLLLSLMYLLSLCGLSLCIRNCCALHELLPVTFCSRLVTLETWCFTLDLSLLSVTTSCFRRWAAPTPLAPCLPHFLHLQPLLLSLCSASPHSQTLSVILALSRCALRENAAREVSATRASAFHAMFHKWFQVW